MWWAVGDLSAQVVVGDESFDTDAQGQFRIAVEPGLQDVQVLAAGYVAQPFTVAIEEAGSSHLLDVHLSRRVLCGLVHDSNTGQPVPGA